MTNFPVPARASKGSTGVSHRLAKVFLLSLTLALALRTACPAEAAAFSAAPTISELFAEADANNVDIAVATGAVAIERARLRQASLLPPQFNAGVRVEPDVPAGLGIIRVESATISQEFGPRAGRISLAQAGDAAIEAAIAGVAAARRVVRQRVITAYYVLAGAQAARVSSEDSLRLAIELERIAAIRQRAGDIGRLDLQRTTLEVRRVQSEQQRFIGFETAARIALNTLVGRPPSEPTRATLVDGQAVPLPDLSQLAKSVALTDPDSMQLRALISQSKALARAAASRSKPSFTVTGGVQSSSALSNGATSFGPVVGASIGLPLGDRGTISGGLAEAQAMQNVAEIRLRGRSYAIRSEAVGAISAMEAAQARLRFATEARALAARNLATSMAGFRSGALSALDVLSTRSNLTTAQSLENEAAVDYATAAGTLRLLQSAP